MKRARKGRLVTAREPNGRIQREKDTAPSEIRRLREAALSGLRDSRWGTELGRLCLIGRIDDQQLAAGLRWAEYADRYRQALLSPSPDPKAIAYEHRGAGHSIDPDSPEGQKEMRRHCRAVASFIDAATALKAHSAKSMSVIREVCEGNKAAVGHEQIMLLSSGLTVLSDFWGLTGKSKSRHLGAIAPAT